jgi:hypothetical protein
MSIKVIFRDNTLRNIQSTSPYLILVFSNSITVLRCETDIPSWLAAFISKNVMMGRQVAMRCISKILRKEIAHLPLGYIRNIASSYSESFWLNEEENLIDHAIKGVASN